MKKKFILLCSIFPALLAAQTPDSTAIKQVDSLVQVSRALSDQRAFDKALEVNTAAEAIVLEKIGRESASYGKTCHNHGRVLAISGNFQEAEKWYLEAIAIQEKTLGKQHPDYAWSLSSLGNVYVGLGKYEKAEPLLLEAMVIREKVLGKENPDYAGSLHGLGRVYVELGKYEKAEPLFLEAITIFEDKLNNREHFVYLDILDQIAIIASRLHNYETAESFSLKVLSISEKVEGKENPRYAGRLINLASVYQEMGMFEKAEPLFLEAITIFEDKLDDKEHPFYGIGLQGLANIYLYLGNYETAEQLYLKSVAIQEKVWGKEHPNYALSLNSLANIYQSMGIFEKAELLFLEAKAILKKTLGTEHPDYPTILYNLGNIYSDMGNFEKAELPLLEAKAILKKTLGTEHPDYAMILYSLGCLYLDMGNFEKAELLLLETKAILKKTLGTEHPHYAMILRDFANFNQVVGNYQKAVPITLEALAIFEKVLGKENKYYVESLSLLASNYLGMGNYNKAEPLYREMSMLRQSMSEKGIYHLSERELGISLNIFIERQDQVLTFAQRSAHKTIAPICYDNALYYKGFLSQATGQIRRMSLSNPTAAENLNQLKACERRLAAQYTLPIAERDSMTIVTLETQANNLEKELARSVAGYAEVTRQTKWKDVQATLKAGEAAIEFVHYKVDFPQKTDSVMYAALLLLPLPAVDLSKEGGAEQPQFIPLFEAKQLGALLKPADKQKVDWVNQLYAETNNGQNALYELLWKPLEPALAGVQTIYFSPSGQLHRLNLGAIALPPMLRGPSEATTLGDRYRLIEVGSTRQLVTGSGQQAPYSSNDAMLYGGIQYEPDTSAMDQAWPELENSSVASRSRGLDFASTDSTLRGGSWKYLPWTKVEVTALDGILTKAGIKATMRKDYEASEEAFKTLGVGQPSPRILHLATHGFFFPDPKTADGKRLTVDGTEPVFKMSDHPMIRSGLLMAGGNYAWEKGKPARPGAEDGILTAYEISQMDLSNTELVVLSACETGLGDIQGNEGVYGLQRAFKIAGAKYLIMSLWQVPDFQTQQLMSTFYRHWLQDKMSIPDAFRAAQQAMQLKFKDPFFWAGFVLVE